MLLFRYLRFLSAFNKIWFISIDLLHTCSIVLIIKVREYFRFRNEYLLHTNRFFMPIERVHEKAHERLDVLGTNEIPIIYYNQF